MKEPSLPQWLTEQESYTPATDKDAFIEKSILSMLHVLSRIQEQGDRRESKRKAHAVVKLTFTLLLVILLSLSGSLPFVLIVVVGLLCRICLLQAEQIARILRNGIGAAVFTAVVLLPAGLMGNWHSMVIIAPKVFVSVSAISLLSYGTRWDELTSALKLFFIPDIFIFVLDIAIKYILLLGDFALGMLYALKLRSVGRNSAKHSSLSGVAGTMFLRSRVMAEEMHSAMECRGFTGEYHRPSRFRLNAMDVGLLALSALVVLVFLYFR